MQQAGDLVTVKFDVFVDAGDEKIHHVTYCVPSLSDAIRNEILYNLNYLKDRESPVRYVTGLCVDVIAPESKVDLNTALGKKAVLDSVTNLRCDGLVELCYELTVTEVWGPNGTNYLIQNFPEEHNEHGVFDPDELSPCTQRGGQAGEGISKFVREFESKKAPHSLNKIKIP